MRTALTVMLICALAACAPRKELTREEYLAATTHEFPGRTPEQVIAAGVELLKLSDGDDFVFAHEQDGFDATRNWSAFLIITAAFGTDHWRFRVTPTANGTRAVVAVSTQGQSTMPTPTTGGSWTAQTGPLVGSPVPGDAIYDIFWARLDYLLGAKRDWLNCTAALNRLESGVIWGRVDPLCDGLTQKDNSPKSPLF